jgi:hypothetical protein
MTFDKITQQNCISYECSLSNLNLLFTIVLEIKPWALCMLGKCIPLSYQPLNYIFFSIILIHPTSYVTYD